MSNETLVVIPARGGSKGIPRKNLSPIGGKPLIAWAIEAARCAQRVDVVAVSTDSQEIASVAQRFGARVVLRGPELSDDQVTLDPVIAHAVGEMEKLGHDFELVATVQPTSPLLRSETIDRAIERLRTGELDTVLSVVDDTHLGWLEDSGGFRPDYAARVNRQQLPKRFRETGGILVTRRSCVSNTSRIGARIDLEVLDGFQGLDIDTSDDWLIAEAALSRRRLAFITIGNEQQGLGHVTRTHCLMECLNAHHVRVFCDPEQVLAIQRLRDAHYDVQIVERSRMLEAIGRFGAEIIVHDELNTDPSQIEAERNAGYKVVVFEDNGPGQEQAHLVFNELYTAEATRPKDSRWFGPSVYCLRDEFRHATRAEFRDKPHTVLLSFGGTDPQQLTQRVLESIAPELPKWEIELIVVAGRGLGYIEQLEAQIEGLRQQAKSVELHRDVPMMSELMGRADFAFSSAGRTLYELAHMGVPTIVLGQNDIEMSHTFAAIENGFLHLGKGEHATESDIRAAYRCLLETPALRKALRSRLLAQDLESGRDFVVRKILEV